jgi:predicted nucleic-acid-binding Zn-ribbon protein
MHIYKTIGEIIMEHPEKCPYCGGTDFVIAKQIPGIESADKWINFTGQILYHKICLNCGTVVRSYVKEPKKLLK